MHGLLDRLRSVRAQNSDRIERDDLKEDNAFNTPHLSINSVGSKTNSDDIEETESHYTDGLNVTIPNLRTTLSIEDVDRLSEPSTARTEDALAIDIVMATNVRHSSARTRSHRGSPKSPKSMPPRASRTIRGSRMSINSTSERDEGSVYADSDDEVASQSKQCANNAAKAWAAFEDAVKNIDSTNPEYFTKKPKPNFVSSGTFQKVMLDMYGNTEYGNTKGYTLLKLKLNSMARATTLASRMMASAVNRGKEEREREQREGPTPEPEVDHESDSEQPPETATKMFAKRGWKILKRQVQDNVIEHKSQATSLNWAMLSHTVRQMTNVERTRQDLYERYGIMPTRLDDGTVVCENRMLSERARAQLHGNGQDKYENRRPHSYQPPSLHLRSKSQLGFQKKGVDCFRSSSKASNYSVRIIRPKTAK